MSDRNEDAKDELNEYDRFTLELLVVNEWGLSLTTLNRMIYCGVSVQCLEVIEDAEISELFCDQRALGQKIMFKHRLKQWRRGEIIASFSTSNSHHHQHQQQLQQQQQQQHQTQNHPNKRLYPFDAESVLSEGNTTVEENGHQQHNSNSNSNSNSAPLSLVVAAAAAAAAASMQPPMKRKCEYTLSNGSMGTGNIPVKIDRDGLQRLLQATPSGRWVLNHFLQSQRLDRKAQTLLTHCIVDQFLLYNILFKHRLMHHYAEVIVELFPNEVKELYYAPRNTLKKNTSGKLFDRYTNQRLRHKDRLPSAKPFAVDDYTALKTFEELTNVVVPSGPKHDYDLANGTGDNRDVSEFFPGVAAMFLEEEPADGDSH